MGQHHSLVDYAIVVGDNLIGAVSLLPSDTLNHARRRMKEEGIPTPEDFHFILPNEAPVSSTQELSRTLNAVTEDNRIRLGSSQSTGKPSQAVDELLECLGPLHHLDDALIAEQTRSFTKGTRRWVFEAFDDWVTGENSHRVFVLSGQAGIGKTGIMCMLARDRRDVVVARHFCRHDDSRRKNPRAMLLSLAYQLAASLPEYGDRIKAHIQQHKLTRSQLMGNEYDSITLFAELFQSLLCDLSIKAGARKRVILIDAIDECRRDSDNRNGILDCIRKYFGKLPPWLGVFITTRPELPITEKLKQFNPIQVEPNMEDNLSDLRIFFNAVLEEDCIRNRIKQMPKASAVDILLRKSHGLFIYAVMAADELRSCCGNITRRTLDGFPEGLDGFYQEQMERAFPDTSCLSWDVLKLAIVAHEPLHIFFIQRLLHCQDAQLKSAVQKLSLFFPVQNHRIQLYHKSLKDWLISDDRYESVYHIKVDEVERELATGCLEVLKESGIVTGLFAGVRPSSLDYVLIQYPLKHCVEHCCSVAMTEDAKHVILDVGWIVTKAKFGDTMGVVRDCCRLGQSDRVVALLGRAVSFSQNALRTDSRQISGQLVGRLIGPASLGGGEQEEVRQRLARLIERLKLFNYGWSWWCPVTATWDQANTVCLRVLARHSGSVRSVEWCRDGKWIVSGSSDSYVRLWDANSGECAQAWRVEKGKVNTVAISSDGSRIAVAFGSRVEIINVASGEFEPLMIQRRLYHCRYVGWSEDNSLLSVGFGTKVLVYDALKGEVIGQIDRSNKVYLAVWSYDIEESQQLAIGCGHNICIYHHGFRRGLGLQQQSLLEGHTDRISSVAWSNGNTQILSGSNDLTIRIWKLESGECTHTFKGQVAAWSPDCRGIILSGNHNSVSIFDVGSGERTHILSEHASSVLDVAWSPDGMHAVTASADRTLRIWDLNGSGVSIHREDGHRGYVSSKSFSKDGKFLVTASIDHRLIVWDASTGKVLHILTGHGAKVSCVACSFGANRELIASGSNDQTVRVWDLPGALCLQELRGHTSTIKAVAWRNDDAFLASGSVDSIRVWDPLAGSCIKVLKVDEGGRTQPHSISALAWSPDGKTLASASTDHHLACWDIEKEKRVIHKPGEPHQFLAYSDDGRHMLSTLSTGNKGHTATIIDASSGEHTQIHDDTNIRPQLSQLRFSNVMSSGSLQLSDSDSVKVDARRFHSFGKRAVNINGDTVQFFALLEKHSSGSEGNKILFLQADPLVYKDACGDLVPMPRLAFSRERKLMRQCLVDACRDVNLSFQAATSSTMQDAVINKVELLHFSGHGAPSYLCVEDGLGGAHFLDKSTLEELYPRQRENGYNAPPHKLVFVSACYSRHLAEVFVSAGVNHVVCCQNDAELEDQAANTFTRSFYMALVVGHSVKVSFEMGRQAVASGPFVLNPLEEKEKFVLLPDGANHDENVILARPVMNWSDEAKSLHWLPQLPNLDSEWQIHVYLLIQKILHHNLVSLVGMGEEVRQTIATALCHYIDDRRSTAEIDIDTVLFLLPDKNQSQDRTEFALSLYGQLVSAGKVSPGSDAQNKSYQEIVSSLSCLRPLLFVSEDCDSPGLNTFVTELLRLNSHLKVLRTADGPATDSNLCFHQVLYEL